MKITPSAYMAKKKKLNCTIKLNIECMYNNKIIN